MNNGVYFLAAFILLSVLGVMVSKSVYFKQLILDNVVCKVPMISKLYMNNLLARFSLSMDLIRSRRRKC